MPVYVVRMSSAVCAISGVWLLDRKVPLPSKKFSRFGSISRSDGTFGLSRKKCTLSNVICTTCWIPLPRRQLDELSSASVAALAGVADRSALPVAANDAPAGPSMPSRAAELAVAVTRTHLARRPARPAFRRLFMSVPLRTCRAGRLIGAAGPTMPRFRGPDKRPMSFYLCKSGETFRTFWYRLPEHAPDRRQGRAEIWRARAKSFEVRPPAEW